MFFFIDLQSEISGGATAWLALGVWINCIAVQCDPTVKAIASENIEQCGPRGVLLCGIPGRVHGKVEDDNDCHRWRKGLLEKPQKKTDQENPGPSVFFFDP